MTRSNLRIVATGIVLTAACFVLWIAFGGRSSDARIERDAGTAVTTRATVRDADAAVSLSTNTDERSDRAAAMPVNDAEPQRLEIELAKSDGSPEAFTLVAVVSGDNRLAHAETDENGVVSFAPVDAPVEVFVISIGTLRLRTRLDRGVGRHHIDLPQRGTVRGSLLVDGAVPRERIHLRLHCGDASERMESPPSFLREALQLARVQPGCSIDVWSELSGRFLADGLPVGWQGTMHLEGPLLFEDGSQSLSVSASSVELFLRLKLRPAVRGRIVDASQIAVGGARGVYSMVCPSDLTTSEIACDSDGHFEIFMACSPVQSLDFTFAAPNNGRCFVSLKDVPPEGLDLGDVGLAPAVDVEFVVREEEGDPIAESVAVAKGSELLESAPTDDTGHGIIRSVPTSERALQFHALGFETETVPLALVSGKPQSLEVRLRKSPGLEVAIVSANGVAVRGVSLVLHSWDTHPFVSNGMQSSEPVQVAQGASSPRHLTRWPTQDRDMPAMTLTYEPDVRGHVRIPGFSPTGRLLVCVEDVAGSIVVRQEIGRESLEKHELVTLFVAREPASLELHVVDERSAPIIDASVSRADGSGALSRSNADGIARIDGIYGDLVDIIVSKAGLDTVLLHDLIVARPVTQQDVVLRPGRRVRVRCVDPSGRVVRADSVSARVQNTTVGHQQPSEDGLAFDFEGLPQSSFRWVVSIDGRWIEQEHDSTSSTADILVPSHGAPR